VNLPQDVERGLNDFIREAQNTLDDNLRSIVLYGSGAEGKLRATSDVNLIVVSERFVAEQAAALAPALATAHAAIRLDVMFLLESEIPAAAECFAQKFADIRRRREVLWGTDPFERITIPRAAEIHRLKQVLLNLMLRLRRSFVERSQHEDALVILIAETVGPLRSCAATLRELEGALPESPKDALSRLASEWGIAIDQLSVARETRALPQGAAAPLIFNVLKLADAMRRRADCLKA
jgi:predicted nucleotidyltransferase